MAFPLTSPYRAALAAAALAAFALGPPAPAPAQTAQAAVSPFDDMSGSWAGTGIITFGTGDKERIRCRASYLVEGQRVRQDLRCASDSYKFEMRNELVHQNGNVTGYWNETTRRTSGMITGRLPAPGRIDAMAETAGFAAVFTLSTRGDRQSVKIESKSAEISDVTITLRRAAR